MIERDLKIPCVIVAMLSVLALAPMPYSYYMFLKIAVTACAGTISYLKFKSGGRDVLVWIFIALAMLFNPFIPLHFMKEIWMCLNIIAVLLFGFQFYTYRRNDK